MLAMLSNWLPGALQSLGLLVCLPLVLFLLVQAMPADPARIILGAGASQDAVANLRSQLGLERPWSERLLDEYRRVATLDYGKSPVTGRLVLPEAASRFATTVRIGLLASIFTVLSSILLCGLMFRYSALRSLLIPFRLWLALPAFLSATLLAVAVGEWLPQVSLVSGPAMERGEWTAFLIPAILASIYSLFLMTRVLDARISDTLASPAYRADRAAGFGRSHLFFHAAFRPSSSAWLAAGVNQLALIVFTVILVELLLSLPGIGSLLLEAVQRKDLPMLQVIILINAAFFLIVRFLGGIAQGFLNPRTVADA
jgi:peptide/nickel transport system permease protein